MKRRLFLHTLMILFVLLIGLQTSYSQEGLSTSQGLKVKTIYIDPSYGGKEHGPRLEQKQYGKDITLLIAKKIQSLLKDNGFNVYLSRDGDQFTSLEERTLRAKSKNADIYIAINIRHRKTDCIRLLYTTPPEERKAKINSETKKLSELDKQIDDMIKDLKIDNKIEESLVLASKMSHRLKSDQLVDCVKVLGAYDYILLNTEMPAITVDFGLSKQSKKPPYILDAAKQDAIVHALATVIKDYLEESMQSQAQ